MTRSAASSTPNAPPTDARRSAPAIARNASAPIISRRELGAIYHRINLTLYKLDKVITGEALDEVIDALLTHHQATLLADSEDRAQ